MSTLAPTSPKAAAHVLVLGGGIAGLTAARHLSARRGVQVTVLESRDRLGGRIHTWDIDEPSSDDAGNGPAKTPNTVDLGASFIHGVVGNPLSRLAKEIPLDIYRPEEGRTRYLVDRSGGESIDRKQGERIEYFSHATTFERLQEAAQRSDRIPAPEESVWSGLLDGHTYSTVWKGIKDEERERILGVASLWSGWTGARLSDVSLRWWGFEQEFKGEDVVVLPGYSRLIDWSVEQIRRNGGTVSTNCKVEAIEQVSTDEVKVSTIDPRTNEKRSYNGTHVVSSLPLGVMQHAPPRFDPPLPARRIDAIERLGSGLLNKIVLSYRDGGAWWVDKHSTLPEPWLFLLPSSFAADAALRQTSARKEQGKVATTKDEAEDLVAHSGMAIMDYSAVTGHPVLLAFVGPPVAQALELLETEWVVATLHRRLAESLLPEAQRQAIPAPTDGEVTRWGSDPHSFGSYSFIPRSSVEDAKGEPASPLDMMECGRPLWEGKLGFCGEHTHPDCYASVHGALLEGEREAKRVLDLLELKALEGADASAA